MAPPPPTIETTGTARNARHRRRHERRGTLSTTQAHLVAAVAEFVGTFFFLWLSYGANIMAVTQEAARPPGGGLSNSTVMIISLAYSFSLLVNVWAFYRISGGLFNPAVTFGLVLSGQLPWIRAIFLVPAQILGSLVAGGLASAMFPDDIALANSVLSPKTSIAQGLFLEMFFTAQLVFVVLMLAMEKSRDTFLAPIGIGLSLFVAMITGTLYTGASLNPVRSLGCAVAATEFPGYHWLYWLGPVMGAALAAGYYRFVKFAHYEEVNPGQDEPSQEKAEVAQQQV